MPPSYSAPVGTAIASYQTSHPPSDFAHLIAVGRSVPWIMPLLFVIAGMSTGFARKRTPAMYLKERVLETSGSVPCRDHLRLSGHRVLCAAIPYRIYRILCRSVRAFLHLHHGITGPERDHRIFQRRPPLVHHRPFCCLGPCARRYPGGRVLEFHPDPGRFTLLWLVLLCIPVWLLDFVGINEGGASLARCAIDLPLRVLHLCFRDGPGTDRNTGSPPSLAAWIALTIGVIWGSAGSFSTTGRSSGDSFCTR
ncbi:MAG: hypothetical protein METHP_01669 [Methanoregula sp. SKADARSKE-2]|nr:MAG: hypothetical protein METHP_01669 [Methanoregula sp. SKADARSKE-2]